jgi:hypothetical protein
LEENSAVEFREDITSLHNMPVKKKAKKAAKKTAKKAAKKTTKRKAAKRK